MSHGTIRPLALCVARHRDRPDHILVFEGYDPTKRQTFYRPLGGGIEFGEYARDAVLRELREELDAELTNIQYLATLENIFTYDGVPGHEIVQLFTADFADGAFYDRDDLSAHEDTGETFHVVWKPLADFRAGLAPLYPDGLLTLLDG
jgi:ADP-ribose pyrophosphatase YjhB (NUDIX family)